MNADMQSNDRRSRPQAAPEVVPQSCSREATPAAVPDFRAPVSTGEGYSASADAVHPAQPARQAAHNPKIIVEIAPEISSSVRKTSAANNPKIIVEVAPEVSPAIHASAFRTAAQSQRIIVEVAPDLAPSAVRATPAREQARSNEVRLASSKKIIVEISPDITFTPSRNKGRSDFRPH